MRAAAALTPWMPPADSLPELGRELPQGLYVVSPLRRVGETRLLCKSLRARGLAVMVLCAPDDAGCYLGCADFVAACNDLYSVDAVMEALTADEQQIAQVALVGDRTWPALLGAAQRLDIRVPGLTGQLNARIKPRMREILARSLPLEHVVLDADACTRPGVRAAVDGLGVPFVVKPIWGQGCDYVELVSDARDAFNTVSRTFEALRADPDLRPMRCDGRTWDPRAQLLIERFAAGREFSFEGYVQGGRCEFLALQEKYRWAAADGIRFETANLCPSPFLRAQERDRIVAAVRAALRALEVEDTFVHVELKWDGDRVAIIEVNPRLGGGSVPALLELLTGADVRQLRVQLALGEKATVSRPELDGFALGVFVNAWEPGTVSGMDGLEWVRAQPEFKFDSEYLRQGEVVPPRGASRRGREAWMYGYDTFYWCQDVDRIDELHRETLRRVRVRCEETTGAV